MITESDTTNDHSNIGKRRWMSFYLISSGRVLLNINNKLAALSHPWLLTSSFAVRPLMGF
jgi:hypothetical protein